MNSAISREEIQIAAQLLEALSEAVQQMEYYYSKRDIENFKRSQQAILDIHKKIAEILS